MHIKICFSRFYVVSIKQNCGGFSGRGQQRTDTVFERFFQLNHIFLFIHALDLIFFPIPLIIFSWAATSSISECFDFWHFFFSQHCPPSSPFDMAWQGIMTIVPRMYSSSSSANSWRFHPGCWVDTPWMSWWVRCWLRRGIGRWTRPGWARTQRPGWTMSFCSSNCDPSPKKRVRKKLI